MDCAQYGYNNADGAPDMERRKEDMVKMNGMLSRAAHLNNVMVGNRDMSYHREAMNEINAILTSVHEMNSCMNMMME